MMTGSRCKLFQVAGGTIKYLSLEPGRSTPLGRLNDRRFAGMLPGFVAPVAALERCRCVTRGRLPNEADRSDRCALLCRVESAEKLRRRCDSSARSKRTLNMGNASCAAPPLRPAEATESGPRDDGAERTSASRAVGERMRSGTGLALACAAGWEPRATRAARILYEGGNMVIATQNCS